MYRKLFALLPSFICATCFVPLIQAQSLPVMSLVNTGVALTFVPQRTVISQIGQVPIVIAFSAITSDLAPLIMNDNSPVTTFSSVEVYIPGTATGGTDGTTPPPLPAEPIGIGRTVGLPEEITWNTALYPNPTRGGLQLDIEAGYANKYRLTMYDMMGRQVRSERDIRAGVAYPINITQAPSGAYIFRLTTADGKYYKVFKVIKR